MNSLNSNSIDLKSDLKARIDEAKRQLNIARQEESYADEAHMDIAIERVGIAMTNLNNLYKQAKLIW